MLIPRRIMLLAALDRLSDSKKKAEKKENPSTTTDLGEKHNTLMSISIHLVIC